MWKAMIKEKGVQQHYIIDRGLSMLGHWALNLDHIALDERG
jgi:hypothetical protein